MHLNTDIIETVYFICAMLIDTPKMAINPQDPDKYTTSRYFKKLMDFHERQASSGLTEGFREYIIAAAQKLRKGYWKEAYEILASLDSWKYVPRQETVKQYMLENLKESGMVTYILTYAEFYENFSKQQLSDKFLIDISKIEKILNSLILSSDIQGTWDGDFLVLQAANGTRIDFLAEKIREKVLNCIEINEKLGEFNNFLSANAADYFKPSSLTRKKKILKKNS